MKGILYFNVQPEKREKGHFVERRKKKEKAEKPVYTEMWKNLNSKSHNETCHVGLKGGKEKRLA